MLDCPSTGEWLGRPVGGCLYQALIKLFSALIIMLGELREEELYEDLSMMLQIVKKKLVGLVCQPGHHSLSERALPSWDHHQTNTLLDGFRNKYARLAHLSPHPSKVIERFFSRIRESLTHLSFKMPRQKFTLVKALRELEQSTVRPVNQYNYLAIVAFLDLVAALKNQKIQAIPSSHERPLQQQKEQNAAARHTGPNEYNLLVQGCKKVSEVEMVQRNVGLYQVMDMDGEHLRARYFDLKGGHEASLEADMLFRNRFIRQITKDYQSQYDRYKRRDPKNQNRKLFCSFHSRADRWEALEGLTRSENRIETIDPVYFHRSSKIKNQTGNARQRLKASGNLNDRRNIENKMTIDTFRSMFEQKLGEKKENIKIKNMVINLNGSEGRLKDRGLNEKRLEFYKRSQDQVRLRYKYYNYNYKSTNPAKSSIKYRTINPESTFNTIDY